MFFFDATDLPQRNCKSISWQLLLSYSTCRHSIRVRLLQANEKTRLWIEGAFFQHVVNSIAASCLDDIQWVFFATYFTLQLIQLVRLTTLLIQLVRYVIEFIHLTIPLPLLILIALELPRVEDDVVHLEHRFKCRWTISNKSKKWSADL